MELSAKLSIAKQRQTWELFQEQHWEIYDRYGGTDEEVCTKIQQANGLHEDLLTIVKRRKLKRYGPVCRSSGLAKTILQSTVNGGKKTTQTEGEVGRQRQGMDRPGVGQVPRSPRGQWRTEKNEGNWL